MYNKKIFDKLCCFDNDFRQEDKTNLLGIDEAGRGPLAGPLVVAAVIFASTPPYFEINDSKKLTSTQRDTAYKHIIKHAIWYKYKIISVKKIEKLNIYQATIFGAEFLLKKAGDLFSIGLLDALSVKIFQKKCHKIIKGDTKSLAIASASVIAKVVRDRIMIKYDHSYPEFSFRTNMGYPTVHHRAAIKKFGILPIHRKTYNPIKEMICNEKIKYHKKYQIN